MRLMAQTHVQLALGSQPDAVAIAAEIMRQRGDQAEPSASLGDHRIPRWPTGAIGDWRQGELFGETVADLVERQIAVGPVLVDLAERHGLDQGKVEALVAA